MGLLDQIEGLAGGKLHEALGETRFGGLDGLLQHLSQSGLGKEVESWLDPQAKNQPVSPDQVHQAIGGGEIEKIAATLGVPSQTVSTVMAKVLPHAAAQHAEGQGGDILH
jgi:uncharacterized protein YidB (DUF937 family)